MLTENGQHFASGSGKRAIEIEIHAVRMGILSDVIAVVRYRLIVRAHDALVRGAAISIDHRLDGIRAECHRQRPRQSDSNRERVPAALIGKVLPVEVRTIGRDLPARDHYRP